MQSGQRNPRALDPVEGNTLSALRLEETDEEPFRVRFERGGQRCGAGLHRPAAFVRTVRDRQGAFALT